jgi:hypothetical protein
MRLKHCFGEELSSIIPEASISSRSRALRLMVLRIQQDCTQTSLFVIRIRNSTQCESRFYTAEPKEYIRKWFLQSKVYCRKCMCRGAIIRVWLWWLLSVHFCYTLCHSSGTFFCPLIFSIFVFLFSFLISGKVGWCLSLYMVFVSGRVV